MRYDLKRAEEAGWVAFVAAAVFLLQIGLDFDPDTIMDWKVWARSVGAGLVRAVAGALLAWRARS